MQYQIPSFLFLHCDLFLALWLITTSAAIEQYSPVPKGVRAGPASSNFAQRFAKVLLPSVSIPGRSTFTARYASRGMRDRGCPLRSAEDRDMLTPGAEKPGNTKYDVPLDSASRSSHYFGSRQSSKTGQPAFI